MKHLVVSAIVLSVALCGCGPVSERHAEDERWRGAERVHRRYQIEVVVDTPQGPAQGSGVVDAYIQPIVESDGQRRAPKLNMEAIPIVLKDGRYIFMLALSNHSWSLEAPWTREQSALEGGSKVLMDPASYPLFGYFADLSKPLTYMEFQASDMSQNVGEGYSLRSISIKRHKGDPESRINSILPWLKNIPRAGPSREFCRRSETGVFHCVPKIGFDR